MELRTVLLPTDFSSAAENACRQGFALAARAQARVLLLHVLRADFAFRDTPLPMRAQLEYELRTEAEQRLTLIATAQGGAIDTLVLWGSPAAMICRVAAEQEVGLIVMSTRGRISLAHLFIRNVVEQVIRHAPCSVLIPARVQGFQRDSDGFQHVHGRRLLRHRWDV